MLVLLCKYGQPTVMSKSHSVPLSSLGNILKIYQLPTFLPVHTQIDNINKISICYWSAGIIHFLGHLYFQWWSLEICFQLRYISQGTDSFEHQCMEKPSTGITRDADLTLYVTPFCKVLVLYFGLTLQRKKMITKWSAHIMSIC